MPDTSTSASASKREYSVRDRQILTQRIGELGPTEHMEIYGIISKNNIDHTRNKNGVFVNMTTLPNEVVHTIHQFVSFCHDNKLVLDEYDKRLNECKFLCARHDESPHPQQQQQQINLPTIDELTATATATATAASTPSTKDELVELSTPLSSSSSVTSSSSSSFKQAIKKFSRKRGCDNTFSEDVGGNGNGNNSNEVASTETLVPEPVLILRDKSAAPGPLPLASQRS